MKAPQKKLLRLGSVQAAADENGLSTKTVRRGIAAGKIPAYRVGRLVKVDLDAARAALLVPMNDAARRGLAEAGIGRANRAGATSTPAGGGRVHA